MITELIFCKFLIPSVPVNQFSANYWFIPDQRIDNDMSYSPAKIKSFTTLNFVFILKISGKVHL